MKNLSFLILICLFVSCAGKEKKTFKVQKLDALPPLADTSLFNPNAVYEYVFESEERDTDSLKKKAKQYFMQAAEQVYNKKNPTNAIPLLVKSLQTFPDEKTYAEIGNVFFMTGDYEKAKKAYEVALKLDVSPKGQILFNLACCHAQEDERRDYKVEEYITNALKEGFDDSSKIYNAPHLRSFYTRNKIKDIIAQARSVQKGSKVASLFDRYIAQFKTLPQSYEISADNYAQLGTDTYISWEFKEYVDEMQNASFGRDVSNEFKYVGLVKKTNQYVAVIYRSDEVFGDVLPPSQMLLVSYSLQGELIDKKMVACTCSPEKIKSTNLESDKITIIEYKQEWASPLTEVPFDQNKITNTVEVSREEIVIQDNGKFTLASKSAQSGS